MLIRNDVTDPHPHCVHCVKAWEEDGLLYICTELLEHGAVHCSDLSLRSSPFTGTLADLLDASDPLPESVLWEFLLDLLLVRLSLVL